jgi:hypothetical protein
VGGVGGIGGEHVDAFGVERARHHPHQARLGARPRRRRLVHEADEWPTAQRGLEVQVHVERELARADEDAMHAPIAARTGHEQPMLARRQGHRRADEAPFDVQPRLRRQGQLQARGRRPCGAHPLVQLIELALVLLGIDGQVGQVAHQLLHAHLGQAHRLGAVAHLIGARQLEEDVLIQEPRVALVRQGPLRVAEAGARRLELVDRFAHAGAAEEEVALGLARPCRQLGQRRGIDARRRRSEAGVDGVGERASGERLPQCRRDIGQIAVGIGRLVTYGGLDHQRP